ncbi:hypothetical protein ACFSCZ_06825 [Siminovitchia sediminis]|uniref:Uncharacterized protein n=1 Tax=Siminovitchia sediminis TaxID=1274353 RepID=A0ABW4KI92_9BACI
MKTYLVIALAAYLTWYTGRLTWDIWKDDRRMAAVIVGIMAAAFPVLAYWIEKVNP